MKKLGFVLIVLFSCLVALYLIFLKPEKYVAVDMYDEIINRGFLKVGINIDSKPFGFVDERGKYIGYDVDLARRIAYYVLNNENKVRFVPVTPSNRLLKLTTGEVDIIIATLTITPQRLNLINFSVPYDSAGQAILVKKSSQINSLADLSGNNVGVIWGTTAEKNMFTLAPSSNIIGFISYHDAYNALKQDKIIAITSDDTILNRFVLEDSSLKMLPKRYTREPYGIGFREGKGATKLKSVLDYAINDMKQKNELLRLHKKWLG